MLAGIVAAAAVIIVLIWGFLLNGFGLNGGFQTVSNNGSATSSSSAAASGQSTTAGPAASSTPATAASSTPAAVATQPIVVTAPAANATVGWSFAIHGTGHIPSGQHLVAFLWATGAQQYFFDGEALQTAGTNQWTVTQVCVGSGNKADVGNIYTVFLQWMDDKPFTDLSNFHNANVNTPVALAGTTVTSWNVTLVGTGPGC